MSTTLTVDPLCPITINLDCFNYLPEAERPTFIFRRFNCREFQRIAAAVDRQAMTAMGAKEVCDSVCAALKIGLIGWTNQTDPSTGETVPFDVERLPDILGPTDGAILIHKRLESAALHAAEKKSSDSP